MHNFVLGLSYCFQAQVAATVVFVRLGWEYGRQRLRKSSCSLRWHFWPVSRCQSLNKRLVNCKELTWIIISRQASFLGSVNFIIYISTSNVFFKPILNLAILQNLVRRLQSFCQHLPDLWILKDLELSQMVSILKVLLPKKVHLPCQFHTPCFLRQSWTTLRWTTCSY